MIPLVSIIIPIYNVEAYLRACLDSVLDQTDCDWEAILVDDASTDSSAAIAAEYCRLDPRFRMISLSANRGLSGARNAGLDAARGRYLAFLDSDDMLHPDFLSVHREVMDSGAGISAAPMTSSAAVWHKPLRPRRHMTVAEPVAQCLYQRGGINPSVCGKMFAASLFAAGLRFREGSLYEDLQIMPELWERAARIDFTDTPLYFYRQRQGSIIHTFTPRRLDVLGITEAIERRYSGDPVLGPAARDRRFSANFNMFLLMCANGQGRSAAADRCWAQIRRLRVASLLNRRVRLRNRIGALVSILLPRRIIASCARMGLLS